MAINRPIIAAGPTKPRIQVLDQPVQTHPVGPGEFYTKLDESNVLTGVTVFAPTREGQVFFQVGSDGGNRTAVMYIGVDLSGTLTWVEADLTTHIDGYTGQPFDPLFS